MTNYTNESLRFVESLSYLELLGLAMQDATDSSVISIARAELLNRRQLHHANKIQGINKIQGLNTKLIDNMISDSVDDLILEVDTLFVSEAADCGCRNNVRCVEHFNTADRKSIRDQLFLGMFNSNVR